MPTNLSLLFNQDLLLNLVIILNNFSLLVLFFQTSLVKLFHAKLIINKLLVNIGLNLEDGLVLEGKKLFGEFLELLAEEHFEGFRFLGYVIEL